MSPLRSVGARAWLKRADGSSILLAFSAAPLSDAEGRIVGTRGMGIDWTEFDENAGRVAASLRRGEVLDHILWRMGQEVLAPRMMQAALDALMNALGAEGCRGDRAAQRGRRSYGPSRRRRAEMNS